MVQNAFSEEIGVSQCKALLFAVLVLLLLAPTGRADESLKVFGYFQSEFFYDRTDFEDQRRTSFVLQHLNLLLQKNLADHWSSYVNFEFTNSYNSSKDWGSFNIQEAWLLYRYDNRLNLKLGQQIPIFNNLNEIKNRTPLLPYIIRPVVYESSLEDVISLDQYVPNRAYVQAYGFLPIGRAKLDYAAYIGNSPNINSDTAAGQTGVDTTDTFLFGGRVGVRCKELKFGFSGSYDESNYLYNLVVNNGYSISEGREIDRYRVAADLSYRWQRFFFEAEYIKVIYNDRGPEVDLDLEFFYATLGCDLTDRLLLYGSYVSTQEQALFILQEQGLTGETLKIDEDLTLRIPTGGIAYRISDRITAKAQYARVRVSIDDPSFRQVLHENYYALAISAFF